MQCLYKFFKSFISILLLLLSILFTFQAFVSYGHLSHCHRCYGFTLYAFFFCYCITAAFLTYFFFSPTSTICDHWPRITLSPVLWIYSLFCTLFCILEFYVVSNLPPAMPDAISLLVLFVCSKVMYNSKLWTNAMHEDV